MRLRASVCLLHGFAAMFIATVGLAAEPDLAPGMPNIWGVWLGTGGADVDPRYRSTPWPATDFTEWGAAQSKLLTTPETPDECSPYGPVV